MWKRLWKVENLKYLVAFLIPVLFILCINQAVDNDSWYVLAEGRAIVQDGVYHEDVLSMHEGMHVVVQNYGFAAIFYLIHLVFGAPGIYFAMIILVFAIMYLLYKVYMLLSKNNVDLSLILMAVTTSILGVGFITTRAQMVDYAVFLILIYVLELFITTDKTKYLWWIPGLSFLLINLHASVWWIIFAIMATYIIDSIRGPRILHLQGYRTKPLLLVAAIAFLVGFLNPYGIEMMTSIFGAYSGVAKLNFVQELLSFNPLDGYNLFYYLVIVVAIALYAFGKPERLRVRYLLMFFGFLLMGLSSIKGLSELFLVMLLPVAVLYSDWKIPRLLNEDRIGGVKISRTVLLWVSGIVVCSCVVAVPYMLVHISDGPGENAKQALDEIDLDVGDKNKEELKVYVGYNQGGYVEYRGYHAYLDPRGEYFLGGKNNKEGILDEWMDLRIGEITVDDFLSKYNFDYMVVEESEKKLYDLNDARYELIFDDDLRVYKRVENVD
jgi:hypothetical protein